MNFKINILESESNIMKNVFNPDRIERLNETERAVKNQDIRLELCKIEISNCAKTRVIEELERQVRQCATTAMLDDVKDDV